VLHLICKLQLANPTVIRRASNNIPTPPPTPTSPGSSTTAIDVISSALAGIPAIAWGEMAMGHLGVSLVFGVGAARQPPTPPVSFS